MAKYINTRQEKLNEAINVRIKERLQEKSETGYVTEEQAIEKTESIKSNQKEGTEKGKSPVKQMIVRVPQEMYDEVIISALAGHDNNFTQYIKDLIMDDYEKNKEYYKECIELRNRFKGKKYNHDIKK